MDQLGPVTGENKGEDLRIGRPEELIISKSQ